jgi:three-Cys-motif partner protein
MIEPAKPTDDGLPIPEVGAWSREKHHFLRRYIDAFTTAMRGKRWSGLHYIDLFAGAGIERIEKSSDLEWGSPMIAAQAKHPFCQLHLCEMEAVKLSALRQRLVRVRPTAPDQCLHGDANARVSEIVATIPAKALSLAFLDPYGLHLSYATLRALARVRADLIVFFPDRLDALRNWRAYYWDDPESNLDAVLGPGSNWRGVVLGAPDHARSAAFLRLYVDQIRKLGYGQFEWEGIPSHASRLYWLIFCSKSAVGARIWRGVAEKKPGGQRSFGFPTNNA